MSPDNYLNEIELRCLADLVYDLNKINDQVSHTLGLDFDGMQITDTNGDLIGFLGLDSNKRIVVRVDLSD